MIKSIEEIYVLYGNFINDLLPITRSNVFQMKVEAAKNDKSEDQVKKNKTKQIKILVLLFFSNVQQ